MKKALVLLSGGQDSATCLAIAQKENQEVLTISFDYGQRHKIELELAQKLAKVADVENEILDLSIIGRITDNALTKHNISIKKNKNGLPNTFVDGRNMVFLTFAGIYAKQRGIRRIYTGVCQTDFSGYPDCRDEFIKSLNKTLNLAMEYEFEIITPLMWLNKAQTVKLMKKLGKLDWYAYTHTCYEGKFIACGRCPACKLRLKGFEEAGEKDLISYAN